MGFLEERDSGVLPTVPDYYKGKTIFITGGSGFMGKVLVEKLLYSCSDLERIYLLLRNKKGVKAEDRLDALYSSRCFDRLRQEKPLIFKTKVFFIAGDACEVGLGMSEEDRTLIINRTNIIFHVAASVRFDDSLKVAANLNLKGTKEVIDLAKEVQYLEAMVHVSTAYTNTNRQEINEIIYPPFADWRDTLEICEKVDDHTLAVLTPKYIGSLPNTYVFTKQLAEDLVYENRGKLPIVILRPSIVISSVSEPVEGWIENFNGPVGILVASGKGILRSLYTDENIRSDYIPVDVAIKQLIVSAWIRGTKRLEKTDDVEVYNCSTSHIDTLTIGQIVEFGIEVAREMPLEGVIFPVNGNVTSSKTIHYMKVLLLHLLPAIFIDLILSITGNKPLLVKIQRRIYKATLALRYYVTHQWNFINKNTLELRAKIKKEDKKSFGYDIDDIDQKEYFMKAAKNAKMYLLNEKIENLPKAKAHSRRIELAGNIVKTAITSYLLWFVVNTNYFKNILQSTYDYFM